MGKKKKLYDLRLGISTNSTRAKYLLENIIYKSESERETNILAELVLDLVTDITKMSEKIGIILKH